LLNYNNNSTIIGIYKNWNDALEKALNYFFFGDEKKERIIWLQLPKTKDKFKNFIINII